MKTTYPSKKKKSYVTTQTISTIIKLLAKYNVLQNISSNNLPLKITFLPKNDNIKIKQQSNHSKLWTELANIRTRKGTNEIEILIPQLLQKLHITKKELTKSLQYLKQKKIIIYDSLKRSGAIILKNKNWKNMINWNEFYANRNNAIENQQKMQQLMTTKKCRRKILLKHFNETYTSTNKLYCCDNCNPNVNYSNM